jgi:hypothetical protein
MQVGRYVVFSELNIIKRGTSCVVYNNRNNVGKIMWISNFAGRSEVLLGTEGYRRTRIVKRMHAGGMYW